MKWTLPTDLQILNVIYKRYYENFARCEVNYKIYFPIDIKQIADDLGIDEYIIFGRLSHLDRKYANTEARVKFIDRLETGQCINFPLMVSVLADLRDRAKKYNVSIWIAVISLVISFISIVISIFC